MNRNLLLATLAVLLVACASKPPATPQVTGPRYTAAPGPNPVGVIPAGSIRDTARNKTLEVSIDYPTKPGPHPLVIFSHGLGSAPRDYTGLAAFWASHGFVVVRPAHADARRPGETTARSEDLGRQAPADWLDRTRDVRFIIDSIPALEQQYPELEGRIDPARIGVGGNSYGAFTTMLLAGARTFMDANAPVSYGDPRITVAMAISPQGPGERRGLTAQSWSEVRIPTLYMTGSADVGTAEGENPEWRRQAFELSPPGDKWFVLLQGAGSATFVGRSALPADQAETRDPILQPLPTDPRDPRGTQQQLPAQSRTRTVAAFERDRQLFRGVQAISLAFWDSYLKNDAKAKEYLTSLTTRTDLEARTK